MHVIRLRGHWSCTVRPDGRTQHTRHFGRPRTLDPDEQIWLTGTTLPAPCEFFVNEHRIGSTSQPREAFAIEITPLLKPRNVLTLITDVDAMSDEIRLEIRHQL